MVDLHSNEIFPVRSSTRGHMVLIVSSYNCSEGFSARARMGLVTMEGSYPLKSASKGDMICIASSSYGKQFWKMNFLVMVGEFV